MKTVSAETRKRMDQLAERVADGSSIAAAGRAIGLSQTMADKLWQRIRRDIGEQAV
jgi:hypothetical protein